MNIKKKMSMLLLMFFAVINVNADEGMWIPMLIGKNYDAMKKQGFKLTPEDLYNVNKASIKDAIVSFGGFCTAEVVSRSGLLFTNHHCGYDAIASNSTVEDNILDNGFWAKSYAQEKPIPGLFVNFLVRMDDVTAKVNSALAAVPEAKRAAAMPEITQKIAEDAVKGTTYEAVVKDFYKANQFFVFIYQKFNDVRLVGTPPQSIGKFGGDTDNWEWPRHTGDFSVFRVYAGKDNKPAMYSEINVPYVPKKHLPVSIKGVKQDDFAMIFGYPGRTDRFLTSYGVSLATEEVSPTIVKLRDIRLKAWKEQMDKDVQYRLNLSSKYAQVANYWKYFIGQTEQLKSHHVFEEKQAQEAQFTSWTSSKPQFTSIMSDYQNIYAKYKPYAKHRTYLGEGLLASDWVKMVQQLRQAVYFAEKGSPEDKAKGLKAMNGLLGYYQSSYNEQVDKKIFSKILSAFYDDIPKDQHPKFIKEITKKYWKGAPEATFTSYAEELWNSSALISPAKLQEFIKKPSLEQLEKDPAYSYASNLMPELYMKDNLYPYTVDFDKAKAELDTKYLKALLEKNGNAPIYPDANSTMRVSYGNVKNYSPKDGITYNITTTMDGMVAKYVPKDTEFDLPANLLQAYKEKNFGPYGNNGTLTVGFITNNDITGGNSGSPVINGKGELIGLAFDGNWEAMSGDIAFDKDFKRTICVDARYVLWCIDVLGGAKNIIAELDIKK
ncbi:S46 family peptidase [Desertivirga brevis]|uniref:S46 family peptidase n=1 Tax=Desertivirga brevis TaxID=2810310 RepID=UPI001A975462|nr:S46 family peptidase [Pedobacter sp. SYSU D00873]